MEFAEVLRRRRMTRRFKSKAVPEGTLDRVLAAVRAAPTAGFSQGIDLLVLYEEERRNLFWELSSSADWRNHDSSAADIMSAPVIIVPISDPGAYVARYGEDDKRHSDLFGIPATDWAVPYWLIDASFATMLLMLAATDAGLDTLFFRLHVDEAVVLKGLGVPPGRSVIGALALGYRSQSDRSGSSIRRARRELDDILHRDHW